MKREVDRSRSSSDIPRIRRVAKTGGGGGGGGGVQEARSVT